MGMFPDNLLGYISPQYKIIIIINNYINIYFKNIFILRFCFLKEIPIVILCCSAQFHLCGKDSRTLCLCVCVCVCVCVFWDLMYKNKQADL